MTVALCTREDYDNNHDNIVSERIGSESGEAVHTTDLYMCVEM